MICTAETDVKPYLSLHIIKLELACLFSAYIKAFSDGPLYYIRQLLGRVKSFGFFLFSFHKNLKGIEE
jgi:hypothetical protein